MNATSIVDRAAEQLDRLQEARRRTERALASQRPGAARRPLPPYAKPIIQMLRMGLRPAILGGSVVVSLDWNLGSAWPRIVIPWDHNPSEYDLTFLRGLDVLIVYRPGHLQAHVDAAIDAVREVKPNVCSAIALPHAVQE